MGKEMVFDRITAKDVGFDLAQEARKITGDLEKAPSFRTEIIESAARQIRTYESETLEDNIVSFYPCFVHIFQGKTKLFSSDIPERRFLIESAIDPLERSGKALGGFEALQERIGEVPGSKFFLWISPKGSAGTEGIYKNINYRYHQIYIGEIDGRKTKAYALKSDIEETILADWVNSVSGRHISITGKTEEFLLNPLVLPSFSREHALETALFGLGELLAKRGQKKFYKDIDISDLPTIIRKKSIKQEEDTRRIAQELERGLSNDRYLGYEKARRAIGGQLYVLYDRYANGKGEIQLTGCAGGSITINSLFGRGLEIPTIKTPTFENIFATEFRIKGLLNEENEGFVCICGWRANGPLGDRPCGGCGLTKEKAKKEGMAVC